LEKLKSPKTLSNSKTGGSKKWISMTMQGIAGISRIIGILMQGLIIFLLDSKCGAGKRNLYRNNYRSLKKKYHLFNPSPFIFRITYMTHC
jgi:hypothetical protein